jgi:hypothetical protein
MKKILFVGMLAALTASCEQYKNEVDMSNSLSALYVELSTKAPANATEGSGLEITVQTRVAQQQPITVRYSFNGAEGQIVIDRDKTSGTGTVTMPAIEVGAGERPFELSLVSASVPSGAPVAIGRDGATPEKRTINVKEKLKLTMEWLVGTWVGKDFYAVDGEQEGDAYPVTITQTGDNAIAIVGVWGGAETLTATVNIEDATISIAPHQVVYADGSDVLYIEKRLSTGFSTTEPTIGVCTLDGIISIDWSAVWDGEEYGRYTTTLTGKE